MPFLFFRAAPQLIERLEEAMLRVGKRLIYVNLLNTHTCLSATLRVWPRERWEQMGHA